jgi:uncharacterized protein
MEQRVSLVTLGVADLGRAVAFYEALGWKRGNREESVAFFQVPGGVLALWSREALAEEAGLPHSYNTRSKAEVDAVLVEAEAAGARILRSAVDTVWGGYSGYFADPDGHPWEVAWNPAWPIAADGSVTLA